MTAAAYPSLTYAVANTVFIGVFAAATLGVFAAVICAEAKLRPRTRVAVIAAVVVAVVAVTVAVAVLMHHAAWVDYRRGAS